MSLLLTAGRIPSGAAGTNFAFFVRRALVAFDTSVIPSASFSVTLSGSPSGSVVFGVGNRLLDPAVALGGGCFLYLDPTPGVVLVPSAARSLTASIPNDPDLVGVRVIAQGAVAAATSNALDLCLGR